MPISNKEIDEVLNKYKTKLDKNIDLNGIGEYVPDPKFSRQYLAFRKEALGKANSTYEKLCNFSEDIIKVNPSEKDIEKIEESISIAHLNITPVGAASFSMVFASILVIVSLIVGAVSYFVTGQMGILLLSMIFILISVLIIGPITRYPIKIANQWRLAAGNQMVLCLLYIVIYMRHTSNLENAIKFASDHISDPLALDLKKVFWDIETGKFSTLKDSLENYLGNWREYNLEFVNSFHLVESSLYEPSEERRLELLDKSLKVILDGTYERMLHYAQDLKNPITMLHMLGVILPILGLVIFPLIGAFIPGVKWYYLFAVYNVFLPIIVYNSGVNILSKRPGSYGEMKVDLSRKKGAFLFSILLFIVLFLIGISPFIINAINPSFDLAFWETSDGGKELFFDFECTDKGCIGPFGLGALILGMFIPLGIALSIGLYFKSKTKKSMFIRNETKKLEREFSTALFQLGTRIGDGIPSELAFRDVAKTMSGTPAGKFFEKIHMNITKAGMDLREAIFNPENGALLNYPSPLVESSMEVLIESSRKGPKVVAQSLTSISNYVSNVHSVNERLKDLLSEIISSMKSQINFMAPVISGIVVGISSMIVGVISKLSDRLSGLQDSTSLSAGGGIDLTTFSELFNKADAIPGYWFQVVVGIYVVQIIYILTVLANNIEFGIDKLSEQDSVGKNIIKGTMIYLIVTLISVLIFGRIAATTLNAVGG
jgi:hypothetical protein